MPYGQIFEAPATVQPALVNAQTENLDVLQLAAEDEGGTWSLAWIMPRCQRDCG